MGQATAQECHPLRFYVNIGYFQSPLLFVLVGTNLSFCYEFYKADSVLRYVSTGMLTFRDIGQLTMASYAELLTGRRKKVKDKNNLDVAPRQRD